MEVIYIVEPIISTSTNKLIAVEVLSRFYSNEGAILSTQKVLGMFRGLTLSGTKTHVKGFWS